MERWAYGTCFRIRYWFHYGIEWSENSLKILTGSLFNHSSNPNVTYNLDNTHACIKFMTSRIVQPEEELCIYYGHSLWFDDADPLSIEPFEGTPFNQEGTYVSGLEDLEMDLLPDSPIRFYLEKELPFKKVSVVVEDEDGDGIETVDAWVIDIPNNNDIAQLIVWLKVSEIQHESLKHAKHIRKINKGGSNITSLLLTVADAPAPIIPTGLIPYVTKVPRYPARTLEQAKIKATIWPVLYESRDHRQVQEEKKRWTGQTVQWFRDAINIICIEAKRVQALGELPIVSYVPAPLDGTSEARAFIAHDTRKSTKHPLGHSVFNLVRTIGDPGPTAEPSASNENGQNYLLTSRTLFTTHEPCVSCSMALVHSRVKEIIYIHPMSLTGGCGGVTCIPALKNINHRFQIWKWTEMPPESEEICSSVDA
ncbi:hypothetical protein Clacol_007580 [Clathrus columnatus]|uniref:Uncharacterized protein n=1 Tax=Clathrus columnatus TaxID=1419009 RepID=A0AAV5AJP4_9AGAM|nr:hypothetical protein Clacol_007580 [Clathrus columnatus]